MEPRKRIGNLKTVYKLGHDPVLNMLNRPQSHCPTCNLKHNAWHTSLVTLWVVHDPLWFFMREHKVLKRRKTEQMGFYVEDDGYGHVSIPTFEDNKVL